MSNPDWTHDVLNGLDPALVEQAAQNTKRCLAKPVRTALAAACLCAALLGIAMAGEKLLEGAEVKRYFSGSQFSEVMQKLDRRYQIVPGSEENYSGYVIEWEGSGVSLENLSREMQELLQECAASDGAKSIRFDSMEEMEKFMGLALYENAVLDQLEQRALEENQGQAAYDEAGNLLMFGNEVVGAVLNCISYKNGLSRFDLLSFYALNNGALEIVVTAEVVGGDLEDDSATAFVFADGTQFSEEAYVTVGGDEINIIRCDIPESYGNAPYTEYSAHFHAYGVRYQVRIMCLENPEECGELLKEILDAFEFQGLS